MDFRLLNLLYRCSREYSHAEIRTRDMSDTEYMICSVLYAQPDCTQDEAAAALKMDKTTVAKALQTLEERGCIERRQDSDDKRKKRLKLTDAGRKKMEGLTDLHDRWLNEVMTCLNEEEKARFEDYCERLLTAAEKLTENIKGGGNGK